MVATRRRSASSLGVERLATFKELCQQHGRDTALKMRSRKRQLEATRDPSADPFPWVQKHPDDPENEDLELMRVFDAATFSRKIEEEQTENMQATMDLNGTQTRSVMRTPQFWG